MTTLPTAYKHPDDSWDKRLPQILLTLLLLVVAIAFLYVGFEILRVMASAGTKPAELAGLEAFAWTVREIFFFDAAGNSGLFMANRVITVILAICWGVGGVAALFLLFNNFVEAFPRKVKQALQPYVFVGPAVLILFYYLALPTIRTLWFSFFDNSGVPPPEVFSFLTDSEAFWAGIDAQWVGMQNYIDVFTRPDMLSTFRNNILWIVIGGTLSVVMGLVIATLADRSRFEALAKSLIFLPMAISMVGAGVIWNFIYEFRDSSTEQIGLLNAIVVQLGGEPRAWVTGGLWITRMYEAMPPWMGFLDGRLDWINNIFLIVIVVWLQTGFAMVIFSAAIKGIPSDLIEAARVDGASELQIFFRIMLPSIRGTILTVGTTIVIFTLKIFDVVRVMTGGAFGTDVIANKFYVERFTQQNHGFASTIAIILLLAVVPVMIYNLRDFRKRETF